jgi:hypothetical protein
LRNPSTWKLQLKANFLAKINRISDLIASPSTAPRGAQNAIVQPLSYGCLPTSTAVFRPAIDGKVPRRLLLLARNHLSAVL